MTPNQKALFDRIQEMKKVIRKGGPFTFANGWRCTEKQYKASMAQLARAMVKTDSRVYECRRQADQMTDAGGRSRSCAFGRFDRDDE